MKKNVLIIFTVLISVYSNARVFDITKYGAIGDSTTINTQAIQKAIDECAANGGGLVYFPSGKYLSGTIVLKDNVELNLSIGAKILASTNHADFPRQPQPEYRSQKDPGGWFSLIYAEGATNIAITGHGTIDGNGEKQDPVPGLLGGDRDGRPRNILFISCKHVRVEGIKMHNSGLWNQHYLDCEDVIIDRIEVYNHLSRNNDAIDIDGCRRLVLSNSILDSDDDGITLKSTGISPTEDIVVTNCVVSCFVNAIKAGTESTGGFRNIQISNCVIRPSRCLTEPVFKTPREGVTGISLEIVDGGIMEGVSISNLTIEGTKCPLFIRLGNRARKHTEDAGEPPVGIMCNISISNIKAYNTGNYSSSITAIPGHYIENVTIDNMQLFNNGDVQKEGYTSDYKEVSENEKGYPSPRVWKNLPSSVMFIRHVRNITIDNLMFGSKEPDPRIPIIAVDTENLRITKSFYTNNTVLGYFALLDQVQGGEIERPFNWKSEEFILKK